MLRHPDYPVSHAATWLAQIMPLRYLPALNGMHRSPIDHELGSDLSQHVCEAVQDNQKLDRRDEHHLLLPVDHALSVTPVSVHVSLRMVKRS